MAARRVRGWLDRSERAVHGVAHRVGHRVAHRATQGGAERGDVPGWVLISLMTCGIVVALWAVAGPLLTRLFEDAVKSVTGP